MPDPTPIQQQENRQRRKSDNQELVIWRVPVTMHRDSWLELRGWIKAKLPSGEDDAIPQAVGDLLGAIDNAIYQL